MTQLTDNQKHIERHFSHQQYNPSVELDRQLSVWNEQCLVGMIETGEITFDDLIAVGGDILAARIGKKAAQ